MMIDTFAEIAAERRGLADLLAGLTAEQQAQQSLCKGWRVHDVVAHLVMPLEVGMPKIILTMLAYGGSFDRANDRVTRQLARRPFADLLETLHRKSEVRFTPPFAGPEAPLADVLIHGLDIRWPLQLSRTIPPDRLLTALAFVTKGSHREFVPKGALAGLRLEAADLDWAFGDGPAVRGPADALLLAITGRTAGLELLSGDGVATLRARLS